MPVAISVSLHLSFPFAFLFVRKQEAVSFPIRARHPCQTSLLVMAAAHGCNGDGISLIDTSVSHGTGGPPEDPRR